VSPPHVARPRSSDPVGVEWVGGAGTLVESGRTGVRVRSEFDPFLPLVTVGFAASEIARAYDLNVAARSISFLRLDAEHREHD
jgi:hypothetical protein